MTASSPKLRLIADDLTGALDTAAEFVPLCGPVTVDWKNVRDAARAAAFDSATREGSKASAVARVADIAARFGLAGADIAYFKVDSLLRGHAGAELAMLLDTIAFARVVIAPAFPFQNRLTREGRQQALIDGAWAEVGEDVAATLRLSGRPVSVCQPGDAVPEGVSVWDCASDADLAAVVDAGRRAEGPLLWCGSGGLATALAGDGEPPCPQVERPVLAVFGTDHPVTRAQIADAGSHHLRLANAGGDAARAVSERLGDEGSAVVSFILPDDFSRQQAALRIREQLDELMPRLDPPGTLICGGGETLRALCETLRVDHLDVVGRLVPGVPVSRMRGGRWDGCLTISKSGAFGDRGFLSRLIDGISPQTAKEKSQ